MPASEWRSQTVVAFEYKTLGGIHDTIYCMAHHAVQRGVPSPARLLTRLRLAEAEGAAARASQETGCPCRCLGPVSTEPIAASDVAELGEVVNMETKLQFAWEHVHTAAGAPHVVTISYHNLKCYGRSVPHCPLRLRDDQGFRYSLAFMDAFAANALPGLTYQGIMLEGPVLETTRELPHGGRDLLATKVYWLFPVSYTHLTLPTKRIV